MNDSAPWTSSSPGCEDTVPSMVHVCKLPEESDASMRARLFTSLSQSFPHSQLYKALHGGEDINLNGGDNSEDDDDSLYGDHLSNSCFASLRMDRRDSDDFDDDLQSLEWLQSEDLLKNIGGEKLDKDEEDNGEQKENEDIKPDVIALAEASRQQPIIAPYLPQEHVKSKPPYSFSCLIFMAVEASPQKRLPVKDIYNWILTQFPYFQNAPTGWKNSVRHNLSLNKCFKKVEKDKGQSIGKGSLWCIDPAYRPNLLQALRKTPYHPYHQLQMTSTQPQNYLQYQSLPGGGRTVLPLTQRPVPNTVSPHLFPFLSRRLAQTSFDVDNEMKDVAQTLVALKTSHKIGPADTSPGEDTGPTWKHHKRLSRRPTSPVVVTEHPYSDHSYSSVRLLEDDVPSPSSSSSIDEEYDFGDAVLSYLLRHTGDSADELFKQLDCSELSYPISDHLFSPHNEESDYQSDMEWESDDKDEVDGDVRPRRKLKIDLKDSDGESWTVKKVANDESEDDEQKKIHEGASALLNLAGLYRSNSSTSNSPDCGSERKKKEGKNEKKKRSEKRLKLSKKKEEKKLPVSEKSESAEAVKKRKVSKRKNAGSNGKYDSEEYSLIKTNRTPTKNQGSEKPSKTKAVKSSITNKDTSKVGSLPLKAKTSIKATNKSVKKGIDKKKKLKLSKNLCAAKKPIVGVAEEKTGPSGSKPMKNVKKKSLPDKKDSNQSPAASVRKNKSSSELSAKKAASSSASKHKDIDGPSLGHSMKSNHASGDAESSAVEKLQTGLAVPVKEPPELQASGFSTILAQTFKGEILSPAGDASSSSFHPAAESKSAGSKLPPHKSKSEVGSSNSAGSKANAGDSSRSPEEKSSASGTLTIINVSHKSPHFTRFSKKKAAMS